MIYNISMKGVFLCVSQRVTNTIITIFFCVHSRVSDSWELVSPSLRLIVIFFRCANELMQSAPVASNKQKKRTTLKIWHSIWSASKDECRWQCATHTHQPYWMAFFFFSLLFLYIYSDNVCVCVCGALHLNDDTFWRTIEHWHPFNRECWKW